MHQQVLLYYYLQYRYVQCPLTHDVEDVDAQEYLPGEVEVVAPAAPHGEADEEAAVVVLALTFLRT